MTQMPEQAATWEQLYETVAPLHAALDRAAMLMGRPLTPSERIVVLMATLEHQKAIERLTGRPA